MVVGVCVCGGAGRDRTRVGNAGPAPVVVCPPRPACEDVGPRNGRCPDVPSDDAPTSEFGRRVALEWGEKSGVCVGGP